jgi:hypothetical protein
MSQRYWLVSRVYAAFLRRTYHSIGTRATGDSARKTNAVVADARKCKQSLRQFPQDDSDIGIYGISGWITPA